MSKWKMAAGFAAVVAVAAIAAGLFFLSPSARAKATAKQFLTDMKYGQVLDIQIDGTASPEVVAGLQSKPLPDVRNFTVTYVKRAALKDAFLVGADLEFSQGKPVPHILLVGKSSSGKWEVESIIDADSYSELLQE